VKRLLLFLLGAALAASAFAQDKKPAKKATAAKAEKAAEKAPEKMAAAGPAIPTENFHAQCIGCHGIPGYKTAFPEVYHVPKIAGQQPAYIIAALKAYKSGDRSHPSMRGIAASLNEEQMKALADYYGAPAK
jgi:cytochrome c553